VSLGRDHIYLAGVLRDYADTLRKLNRVSEAIQSEARAKAILEKKSGKGHQL
jgi:hypothetical protein